MKTLDTPLVSVVIPTYNRGHYLREAIDSVLDQDICDCKIEIIVVDDGSTDDTAMIVKTYYPSVKYLYQANLGAGAARNIGIEHATGEWIAFLDSDDRWLPDKLSLQFEILKRYPGSSVIHSNFYTFDETGITIENGLEYWVAVFTGNNRVDWNSVYSSRCSSDELRIARNGRPFDIYDGNIFRAQLHAVNVSCWTLMVKRKCLGSHIRFAENYSILEDHWFACFLAERFDFVFINTPTAENRGHRGPRLTQVDYSEKLKCQIDICKRIYFPSQSVNRPADQEIEKQYKKLNIGLFKEYLKKGMRAEAAETYKTIQALKAPYKDKTFWLYRLLSQLPSNTVQQLAGLKRFFVSGK